MILISALEHQLKYIEKSVKYFLLKISVRNWISKEYFNLQTIIENHNRLYLCVTMNKTWNHHSTQESRQPWDEWRENKRYLSYFGCISDDEKFVFQKVLSRINIDFIWRNKTCQLFNLFYTKGSNNIFLTTLKC